MNKTTRSPAARPARARSAAVLSALIALAALAALLAAAPPAAAQSGPAPRLCPEHTGPAAEVLNRLRGQNGGVLSVTPAQESAGAGIGRLNLLPARAVVRLVVPQAGADWTQGQPVRVVAVPKTGGAAAAEGLYVTGAATGPDGALELRARLDAAPGGAFWAAHDLLAFGCSGDPANPAFLAQTRVRVSALWPAAGVAAGVVVLFYLVAARTAARRLGGVSFDPVQITAGVDGRGSISKLQILFFSLIVAGMLVYVLLRVGRLGDLSTDVLLLLGISGAGGAAVKQAAVMRRRIAAENWSWLRRQGWQPPPVQTSWRDLVMEGAEFDIYRFQILIFSLVVGGALLFTGLFGLADFQLPPALVGLLGLSQVVYLGGKVVSRPETAELDRAITALRRNAAQAAQKARGAGDDPKAYDYSEVPESETVASEAADVELLTQSVFGGERLALRGKLPHQLV
jgi:hypothetical protein